MLGDAIHFVLCGLRSCKLSDIVCQDMPHGSSQEQGPAAAVSVTLTFELPAADQGAAGQTPRYVSFTRSHAHASSRGSLQTVQDACGQLQQLSEVRRRQYWPAWHYNHASDATQLYEDRWLHACITTMIIAVQAQFGKRLLEINLDTKKVDRSVIPAA